MFCPGADEFPGSNSNYKLFSAIPVFGEGIVTWLWGNFSVDDASQP